MCHGQPVVRGLRYPVWSVLEYLASGMSEAEILADYSDLEAEDLRACQAYAASILRKMSQPITSDETRQALTKQELLAHLIQTGKVPPGTGLNEEGQLPLPQ